MATEWETIGSEMAKLRNEMTDLRLEIHKLRNDNKIMRTQISQLEAEFEDLQSSNKNTSKTYHHYEYDTCSSCEERFY